MGQSKPSARYLALRARAAAERALAAASRSDRVPADPDQLYAAASGSGPAPSAGYYSAPREPAPREPAPRELAPREPTPREPTPRDYDSRQPAPSQRYTAQDELSAEPYSDFTGASGDPGGGAMMAMLSNVKALSRAFFNAAESAEVVMQMSASARASGQWPRGAEGGAVIPLPPPGSGRGGGGSGGGPRASSPWRSPASRHDLFPPSPAQAPGAAADSLEAMYGRP